MISKQSSKSFNGKDSCASKQQRFKRSLLSVAVLSALGVFGGTQAAYAADCPTANAGEITVTNGVTVTAVEANGCDLVNGESVIVNTGGSFDVQQGPFYGDSGISAIHVGAGVTADKIHNEGSIAVGNSNRRVAVTVGGTLTQGFYNSGIIHSDGSSYSAALYLDSANIQNGIINSGEMTGVFYGVDIGGSTTITGGIENTATGVIQGSSGMRIITSNTEIDLFTNAGLIQGVNSAGLELGSLDTFVNTGNVIGANKGIVFFWGGVLTNFSNEGANAEISGGSMGMDISSATPITDSFMNEGVIQGGDAGIRIRPFMTTLTMATLENSGVIEGTENDGSGIIIDGAEGSVATGIDNASSGVIRGGNDSGAGITVANPNNVSDINVDINNAGTVSGDYAIYIDESVDNELTINNSGHFAGKVELDQSRLNLNGDNAQVTGAVTGTQDASVYVNGHFASDATFDVGHFEVSQGAEFTMRHDVTASSPSTFANQGVVAVEAGDTVTITGRYEQTGEGAIRTHVINDTTYGKLVVTGEATLPSQAKIQVDVANPNYVFAVASLDDVLSAGTLISDGTFAVEDNSLLFDFQAIKDGNTVDLTYAAAANAPDDNDSDTNDTEPNDSDTNDSGNDLNTGESDADDDTHKTPVQDLVKKKNHLPAEGAAAVLDQVIADNPTGVLAGHFINLTNEDEVVQAITQTLPLLTGETGHLLGSVLSEGQRLIQGRLALSWREDFSPEQQLWIKPFGSWATEKAKNGYAGFRQDTQGLMLGKDGEVTDGHRIGFAFAYAGSDVRSKAAGLHQADIETYQAILYGTQKLSGNKTLHYQADLGNSQIEGHRRIAFANTAAELDFDSWNYHVGLGVEKDYSANHHTSFNTGLKMDYRKFDSSAYHEQGAGALNLSVDASNAEDLVAVVSGGVMHRVTDNLQLNASAGIGYDLINDQEKVVAQYEGGGEAFVTQSEQREPWLGQAGLGMSKQWREQLDMSIQYDVEVRDTLVDQAASATLRWSF